MDVLDKNIVGIELRNNDLGVSNDFNALNEVKFNELIGNQFEEVFVLSSCQRLAVFVFTNSIDDLLSFVHTIGINTSDKALFQSAKECAQYLFDVASGTKSIILGENEILGQIKKAHALALELDVMGPHLDELVRAAIHCGKLVRSGTNLSQYTTSYISVGLSIINEEFNHDNLNYLIVGTGSIAETFLKVLTKSSHFGSIQLFSHSEERAQQFADEYSIGVVTKAQLYEALDAADVIIGGTHTEVDFRQTLLGGEECPRKMITKATKNTVIIDYGSPANFPMFTHHTDVAYYALPQIAEWVEKSKQQRSKALPEVNKIIEREVDFFIKNFCQRKAAPIIGNYWNRLKSIQMEELNGLLPKMGTLSPRQINLLHRYTNKMIRSISKEPIAKIKSYAEESERYTREMNTISRLYNMP